MIALPLFAFAPMVMTGAPRSATMGPVRTFNTAGPVRAHRHYQIAPLSRIDIEEVLGLIRDEKYFVLHAPRQTGKTSALLALRDLLNGAQAGDFRCRYANVENAQASSRGAGGRTGADRRDGLPSRASLRRPAGRSGSRRYQRRVTA